MSLSRCTSVWSSFRESVTSWLSSFGTSADSHSCDHDYEETWGWPELGNISTSQEDDRLIFSIDDMVYEKCTECGYSPGKRKVSVRTFTVDANKIHEHEVEGLRYYAR